MLKSSRSVGAILVLTVFIYAQHAPARAFEIVGPGHIGITRTTLDRVRAIPISPALRFSRTATLAIVLANLGTDDPQGYLPGLHFDDEQFGAGARSVVNFRQFVLDAAVSGDQHEAWFRLGRILHTIQDFYAHSSWVEAERAGERAGIASHFDRGLLSNRARIEKFLSEMIRAPSMVAGCDGFRKVKASSNITSSYYPGFLAIVREVVPFQPAGKCVHLGGTIGFVPKGSEVPSFGEQGFEKDSPDAPLHGPAFEKAVEASQKFVQEIVDELIQRNTKASLRAVCVLLGQDPALCVDEAQLVRVWRIDRLCVNGVAGFAQTTRTSATAATPSLEESSADQDVCVDLERGEVFCQEGDQWIAKSRTLTRRAGGDVGTFSQELSVQPGGTFTVRSARVFRIVGDGPAVRVTQVLNFDRLVQVNPRTGEHFAHQSVEEDFNIEDKDEARTNGSRTLLKSVAGGSSRRSPGGLPQTFVGSVLLREVPASDSQSIPPICFGGTDLSMGTGLP